MNKSEAMIKILKEFMLMWLLTGLGMFIGSFLPPAFALGMSVLAIVVLIATFFIKKTAKINKLFYAVPFLMGFAFYYSVNFYLSSLGAGMVAGVLVLAIIMFVGLGVLGFVAIKKNLGFMGKFLLFALLLLIVVSIIGLFFSSHMLQLILALGGIVIFSLYTLYDFNRIQHDDISSEETTGYALNLYLNFLNLFLDLLRLAHLLFSSD